MRPALCFLITLAVGGSFAIPAAAATNFSASYQAARAPHPLALDPSLSDPAWQAGRMPDAGGFTDLTTRSAAPHA
ncbi:MAG TPA: hypothetical protein VMS32_05875, partial [Verrucomicrobiae bacterium]|nr:hypothetical protein [Verrucomicrobiae bacterium]